MKKGIIISLKLTGLMLLVCAVLFPLFIAAVGWLAPGRGKGVTVKVNGKVVGYELIGQQFTDNKYFRGRPSAVDYNAAGSAGSNKGPSNPDYIQVVQDRIDSFLVHNPGVDRKDIPADLVTASGSGLDPDISPAAAYIQVKRVAAARGIAETKINELVQQHTHTSFFEPSRINVLKLNIALDNLK